MIRGTARSTLWLAAGALVVLPFASADHRAPTAPPRQIASPDGWATGIWQSTPRSVGARWCGGEPPDPDALAPASAVFAGAPWTFFLTQTGSELSGALQQSGWQTECLREPAALLDGSIEGNQLSFKLESPSGMTVELIGVLRSDGRSMLMTRSVAARGAAPPYLWSKAGLLEAGPTHFVVQRLDPSTLANECVQSSNSPPVWCQRADPTAPPFATGTTQWVVTEGVAFSPWTFDLTIGTSGAVTGEVRQNPMDAPTRSGPVAAGPFAITSGQADARAIAFSVTAPNGHDVVRFYGARQGSDVIELRRQAPPPCQKRLPPGRSGSAQVPRTLPDIQPCEQDADTGDRAQNNLFGTAGATQVVARLVGPAEAPALPPTVADTSLSLGAIDDRFAVVPARATDGAAEGGMPAGPGMAAAGRPALALVPYEVQPSFQGRLALLVQDATGQLVRSIEVIATPGRHMAMWDLQAPGAPGWPAPDIGASDTDLRIAEAGARIVADALHLADDAPVDAARMGLGDTLAGLLGEATGGDARQARSRLVQPGRYTIALARLDGGALAVVATRPLVVAAAGPK